MTLTVGAEGNELQYQWWKNGAKIHVHNGNQYHDVTTPKLRIENSATANNHVDGQYSCEVRNLGGNVSSRDARIAIGK